MNNSEIVIYKTDDGKTKIDVRMQDETVWLTQKLIGILFDTGVNTINYHLKEIFKSGELEENSVIRKIRITAPDGKEYLTNFYNLDAIISVGYRVNSQKATQFRIWATQRLKEYIVKGFTLDDDRLKNSDNRYFDELLERIRDIRSSERNFYQKVTDIYTTSIDYKKDDKLTKEFFATVQNKMHYAVHGHTAAELINMRADCKKRNMGLTNFKESYLTENDIKIAKNYLSEDELKQLNLIVSLYLDFAELQASNGKAMRMIDWINKLDEILKLSEKKILLDTGKISSKRALLKAKNEFKKYKEERDRKYISDFDREMKKIQKESKK
ncbi:MAG TPA: virulence RhuM family protein [Candidatus Dojkabacteria bacterium]|nr:virulence RhuM family protein [Candidatus Dojkabacteria bacterium]